MTIDEFRNVDLRIGKVLAAERVEGSEKLIKLSLDIGEPRQVLAGVGKQYTPEELVGTQVVIVANLEPRMMMGLESQGMLLAANDAGHIPVILRPDKEVPPGAKIS